MSDVTLLIARLRAGAWNKKWPEGLLLETATRIEDLVKEVKSLRKDCLELTEMLDEGQSLALDAGDPETMYRLQRDLASWDGRANTLMYEQAKDGGNTAGGE